MTASKMAMLLGLFGLIAVLHGCSDPTSTADTTPDGADVIDPFGSSDTRIPECSPALCDDGNPCTTSSCDPIGGNCLYSPVSGAPTCDDSNACTTNDRCNAEGVCTGENNVQCDDGKPCTVDKCDTETGCTFEEADEGSTCSDGDPCTTGDGCLKGTCTGSPVFCEEDDNPCTEEAGCSPDDGSCLVNTLEDGTTCDDGNACTQDSSCMEGVCSGGEAIECNDGNDCTDDSCSPKNGCSYAPNQDPCSDDSVCTSGDQCAQGQCQSTPIECDDENPCTSETCDPLTGCVYQPVSLPCEDGNLCTVNDLCADGQCESGDEKACNDGNLCTLDTCSLEDGVCTFAPVDDPCDDGSVCTVDDFCVLGSCIGDTVDCEDGNPCTGIGCDPSEGCSFSPISASCDDGDPCTVGDICDEGGCEGQTEKVCTDDNPCTVDSCVTGVGCSHSPAEGACEDGNPCTEGDTCEAGFCDGGTPTNCDDGNICTADSCDSNSGCTHLPQQAICDDGNLCTNDDACDENGFCSGEIQGCTDDNPCTTDTCLPESGCSYGPQSGPCEDGDACFAGDFCEDEACIPGDIPACDDGNVCTLDTCNEDGSCTSVPVANLCDDGDACTSSGVCDNGTCSTTPINCDDDNSCTQDLCNPQSGCLYAPLAGQSCEDGDLCTEAETCIDGACSGGNAIDCDDENPCTADACDASSGCDYTDLTGTPCEDGNPCTDEGTCNAGTCVGSASICECEEDVDCAGLDDGDMCTGSHGCNKDAFPYVCEIIESTVITCVNEDPTGCTEPTCNPSTGVCKSDNVPTNSPCTDGDPCTSGEVCIGGSCVWGLPVNCEDGNPCTNDSCEEGVGCVFENNANPCDDGNSCTTEDACLDGACFGSPCEVAGLECVEGACIDTCYGTKFTCPGKSCLDILQTETDPLESGTYWIAMEGVGNEVPFQVFCDMVKDGGGWTGITPTLAMNQLSSYVVLIELIDSFGMDLQGRPFCEDDTASHSCRYGFDVPFGYTDFYLLDFTAKPTENSTYIEFDPFEYIISGWVKGNDGTLGYTGQDGFGDIALGPYPSDAPVTSFASTSAEGFTCQSCEIDYPGGSDLIFSSPTIQNGFGICWGEAGAPSEGIFPWWGGMIMVR